MDKNTNRFQDFFHMFRKNKSAMAGLVIILVMVVVTLCAPYLAPNNPIQRNLSIRLKPGSWAGKEYAKYPLGTDYLGRCLLSRIIWGTRTSLSVGFIAVLISTVLGLLLGVLGGYFGKWIDTFLMRIVDVLFAFPSILLSIAIMAALGPGLEKAMIAIGIVYAPQMARVVRSAILVIKEMDYIEAERALGASHFRIIWYHILPNVLAPVIVYSTLSVAGAILDAAALGFLGLGAIPPTPEWGAMLSNSRQFLMSGAWWAATFPGLAIVLAVLGLNLLGDGLRDALDPRLRM
ncbi:MAG: ABC transporter permease [Candidatus Atribacteria bacterium]|nr:ABC transporter permease [Candidatus Atribacteria bacterium]